MITPNPKTSGGARWNYMAAWAYANEKYNGNETEMKAFIKKLYKNVLVLDSGARGATTSFVENGQGDVLIAWENEAFLSVRDNPDDYEIVTPGISILAQPSVAVVDENVKKHDNADAAKAYLKYLYSDEAQELIAENYYRPVDQTILKKHADTFNLKVKLTTIKDFGGWDAVQKKHFAAECLMRSMKSRRARDFVTDQRVVEESEICNRLENCRRVRDLQQTGNL